MGFKSRCIPGVFMYIDKVLYICLPIHLTAYWHMATAMCETHLPEIFINVYLCM